MKFKTFEQTLLTLRGLYDSAVKHDRKLEDALGGNTQVSTTWWDDYITDSLHIIEKDMDDKKEIIGWLFWDSMCNDCGYSNFVDDGVEYEGNLRNVWLSLKGKLPKKETEEAYEYKKPNMWITTETSKINQMEKSCKYSEMMSKSVLAEESQKILDNYVFEFVSKETTLKIKSDFDAMLAMLVSKGYMHNYNSGLEDDLTIKFNVALNPFDPYEEYEIEISENGVILTEVIKDTV